MCDDEIHVSEVGVDGLEADGAEDAGDRLTRRSFSLAAAAVLASSGAAAGEPLESDVDVSTPDGSADAALFRPAGQGRWPAVLLWTDILGLRPVFRQMGRRLAAAGYVVLVPNPFYRVRRAPIVDGSFDFAKPEDRAKVMPLAGALTPDVTARDATAFMAFLDAQPQTDTARKAGVQGYCMGGALSFRSAAARPDRFAAVATFHGGSLATDKPDSPHRLVGSTNATFYCAVADNDDKRDPAAKDLLRGSLAAAHRPARVEVYDGADHGWCVPGSPAYRQASAERAWSELLALYASALV